MCAALPSIVADIQTHGLEHVRHNVGRTLVEARNNPLGYYARIRTESASKRAEKYAGRSPYASSGRGVAVPAVVDAEANLAAAEAIWRSGHE